MQTIQTLTYNEGHSQTSVAIQHHATVTQPP